MADLDQYRDDILDALDHIINTCTYDVSRFIAARAAVSGPDNGEGDTTE